MLLIATWLRTATASETGKFKSAISSEFIYPRELYYTIPFEISAAAFDNGYLIVGEELEKMKIVKIERQGNRIRFIPAKDTYDVIKQNVNLRYDIESLAILLCAVDITVKEIKQADGKIMIYGETYLKDKTKVYESIIAVLPSEKRREYLPQKIEWQMMGGAGTPNITERIVD